MIYRVGVGMAETLLARFGGDRFRGYVPVEAESSGDAGRVELTS